MVPGLTDDQMKAMIQGKSKGLTDEEMRAKVSSPGFKGKPSIGQSALASSKIGAKNLGIGASQLAMMPPPQLGLYGAEDEARWFEKNAEPAKQYLNKKGMANEAEFSEHMSANPITSLLSRGATEGLLTGPLAFEKAGAQAAGYGPRILQSLGRGGREGAKSGAAIGGLGFEPEGESRLMNAAQGTAIGAPIGAAGSGLFAAANPKNIMQGLRGNVTDEQLLANARAAQGTETSLGRVTENSWLRDLSENALAYIPGAGARGAQKRTTQELEKRTEKVLDILGGGKKRQDVDLNEMIQKELQGTAKGKRQVSSENYKKMNELADTLGIEFDVSNLQSSAKAILEEIERSPSLSRRARQKNPDLINDLEYYSGLKNNSDYELSNFNDYFTIGHNPEKKGLPPNYITLKKEGENARVATSSVHEKYLNKGIGKELYRRAIDESSKRGLKFKSDSFVSDDALRVYKALEKEGYIFKKNPETKKIEAEGVQYNVLDDVSEAVMTLLESPKNKTENLESLGILRGELGEDAWNKLLSGERNASGKYAQLKEAVSRDINEKIAGSGSEELQMLGQNANQYYKENIVPLEHPRLKKYINDTGRTRSEDIVPEFIRQGKIDRPKRAEQLIGNLGQEGQEALRQSYFAGPRLEGGAKNFQNQVNKIGPRTLEALVPDQAVREQVTDLANLARMNPEGFIDMFNPKTGARAMFAEGAKMLAGGATSFAAPFLIPLAYGVNKALTSQKVRDAVVKELTKSGKKSQDDIMTRIGEALRTTGANTTRGTAVNANQRNESSRGNY